MKVLVTGATGFVGMHLTRRLLNDGHSLRLVVRPGSRVEIPSAFEQQVESIEMDVFAAAPDALASAARGAEACVHLAWYAVPGKYLSAPENLACVTGSLRLLEALAEQGCRRAIFVGSCFEYDFSPGFLREDGPTRPQSLYAACKLATQLIGEQIANKRELEFVWARLFYLYGPGEDARRLVPHVIGSLLRHEAVELTRGAQVRDFLHVEDVASALATLLGSSVRGVVNVGSGQPLTVREIVVELERIMDVQGLARYGARPENPTDPPFVCADASKLAATGWKPKYDLEHGLRDTIEWWRGRRSAVGT